ncbi:GNAT family N-acetyltransferase [Larkinella terrae]|uniref:GNAT family N-acetyltransferase n=1 Tax=Larkinella terrae TaxID=2025311 RepID=A0A7K0ELT9_9BACT|nr:GNAT family N-acetyltransferase [Larkinella terrae]MRS62807.1 GNAT family N-acetyltransferase [Larkinella terrae]
MNQFTCKRTTAEDPDFRDLIALLDQDLRGRYQPYQAFYDGFNKVDDLARVVVILDNEQPVGCGCFRPTDDPICVEIKRMFVAHDHRRKGIAERVLRELENWALEERYHFARLETGTKQLEAVGLYLKSGYQRIENYGPYAGMSTSICMEKRLVFN